LEKDKQENSSNSSPFSGGEGLRRGQKEEEKRKKIIKIIFKLSFCKLSSLKIYLLEFLNLFKNT